MKKRRRSMLPRGDINVTPMIDILLVLLVIFMTITPMTPTGLRPTFRNSLPQVLRAKTQRRLLS